MTRDPLSERVHLTKPGAVLHGSAGAAATIRGTARSVAGFSAAESAAMSATEQQSETAEAPAAERRAELLLSRHAHPLPPEQRQAMYEVYAFCRAVDDIADDGGPGRNASPSSTAGGPESGSSTPEANRPHERRG